MFFFRIFDALVVDMYSDLAVLHRVSMLLMLIKGKGQF